MMPGASLQALLDEGARILREKGNQEAELDARYLLLEAFGLDLAHFLMDRNRTLPEDTENQQREERYFRMIEMRAGRVPLQQILGVQDFMGMTFQVNAHVLIPRQDTETLVELVLQEQQGEGKRFLDLCTGSGCIAISLMALGGFSEGVATDLSPEALKVAERNRESLLDEEQREKLTFYQGDLFEALPEARPKVLPKALPEEMKGMEPFDVLVSNPPYIPSRVIEELEPEVRDFEPRMALDGSLDGLAFYRRIIGGCKPYLKPGASVYLEIGYDQGAALRQIFEENGFVNIRIQKDAPGKDRVAAACLP